MIENTKHNQLINYDNEYLLSFLYTYPNYLFIKNNFGETLLHYISFYGYLDKYILCVNFENKFNFLTNNRDTLLHYSSFAGKDIYILIDLIKNKLSPLFKNKQGLTPIHFSKNTQIAHYFNMWCIRNNVDLHLVLDDNGNSVLHTAFLLKNKEVCNYWINQYPKLTNIQNNKLLLWNDLRNSIFLQGLLDERNFIKH